MKLNLKWSQGNTKLQKLDTVSFNLPAFKSETGFHVCPKAGGCATMCYARQGRYMFKSVRAAREFNLTLARGNQKRFGGMLVADLQRLPNQIVRIHDSGDFFSQRYLDTWVKVIKEFPEKSFYCYTKSFHLDWNKKPRNFQVIQSVGGLMDVDERKPHSKIFATEEDRIAAGYVDGNTDDQPAIDGVLKIGLVYHGQKSLKPGQIQWLKEA